MSKRQLPGPEKAEAKKQAGQQSGLRIQRLEQSSPSDEAGKLENTKPLATDWLKRPLDSAREQTVTKAENKAISSYTDRTVQILGEKASLKKNGSDKAPSGGAPEKAPDGGGFSAKSLAPEFNPKSIVAFAPLPSSDDLADLLVKLGADENWAKLSSPAIVETLLRLSFEDVAPSGPEKAPILYEDRPKGMTPPQFLKTYYKDYLGTLSRRHLRAIDPKASQALYNWEMRHPTDPDLKDVKLLNHKTELDSRRPSLPYEIVREAFRLQKQLHKLPKS